ncbi:hypothetical protein ACLOJK_012168 [Asimina triloba]
MKEGARVRLQFEDKRLLSKSQRSDGLKCSWLFLTPDVKTISDLSSHLIHKFALRHATPNALVLSMDGYVLPAFESTCIFQDKDIIRVPQLKNGGIGGLASRDALVKRKDHMLKDITRIDGVANHSDNSETFDKQPVISGPKLLAIERFDEDSQREQDMPFEDALQLQKLPSESPKCQKKRKRSDKLKGSRRKKARSTIPEKEQVVSVQYLKKDAQTLQSGSRNNKAGTSRSVFNNKDMLSIENGEDRATIAPTINDSDENIDHSRSDEGCVELQEKREESTDTSNVLEVKRMLPSRSARRKKAKRKWLRELKISQRKEATENSTLEKDGQQESPVHQQTDPSTDIDDEVVPVVIRPGHIRFEPLGTGMEQKEVTCCRGLKIHPYEEGKVLQELKLYCMVIIQWNGTTNKKKGQKWGKEKPSEHVKSNNAYHEKSTEEEEMPAHDCVDFEKLVPLRRMPQVLPFLDGSAVGGSKEGDMVAYRLIELSSSWSPELSLFRVGKISSYDSKSNMVKLVSVPEYPVLSDKVLDDEMQSSFLLYNEDGSLEISFESLVDVRIFNHGKSEPSTIVPSTINEASVHTREAKVAVALNPNAEDSAPVRDNGGHINGAWDEICQALSEKKAQLIKNDGWRPAYEKDGSATKESSGRASWSYKALRSSALGPTMALLRAQNDLQT